jgi:hypothetical protein
MPTQQSHTLPSRTSRHTSQNLAKSVPAPPQDKFNFFLPALRCFNFFATHNRHKNSWTETAKTFTDKGLTMTEDRRPAYNSGFAKKRVQWLIQNSTSHQLLCYVDSFELRNPLLRKAAKRCMPAYLTHQNFYKGLQNF